MDLRGYKTAPPVAVRLAGELLWLAVLPRIRVQRAEQEAAALFRAYGCDPAGPWYALTCRAYVLATALGWEPAAVLSGLDGNALARLWGCWADHQGAMAAVPDSVPLREELRKRVNDTLEVMLDGEAAWLSGPEQPNPGAFYGRPAGDLTDAQIDYYTLVRAAVAEFFVGPRRKEVSAEWLASPSSC